jgi:hypothetical protein
MYVVKADDAWSPQWVYAPGHHRLLRNRPIFQRMSSKGMLLEALEANVMIARTVTHQK